MTARAVGDAGAFVAPCASDATVVLPGSYLAGSDEIRAAMTDAFAGPLNGSWAGHKVQSRRFPDAGAAIVISSMAITRITVFADPGLLASFGFPPVHPAHA